MTPRRSRRITGALCALMLAALLPACLNLDTNLDLPDWNQLEKVPATKREVYERFGAPTTITKQGDGHGLTYSSVRLEGRAMSLLGITPGVFGVRHLHRWPDQLTFFVDADGKVIGGWSNQGSEYLEHRLWPFGEYGDDKPVPERDVTSASAEPDPPASGSAPDY